MQHTVEVKQDGAAELALDTRDLKVSGVTVNGAGETQGCCGDATGLL